jgi:hypothetical protein
LIPSPGTGNFSGSLVLPDPPSKIFFLSPGGKENEHISRLHPSIPFGNHGLLSPAKEDDEGVSGKSNLPDSPETEIFLSLLDLNLHLHGLAVARGHLHTRPLEESLVLVRQLLESPEEFVSPQDAGYLPGVVFLHYRNLIDSTVGETTESGPKGF